MDKVYLRVIYELISAIKYFWSIMPEKYLFRDVVKYLIIYNTTMGSFIFFLIILTFLLFSLLSLSLIIPLLTYFHASTSKSDYK